MASDQQSELDGQSRSVADYAAALASSRPTPGGGSAVAVVAALAAALGEMVCQFTTGRAAYAEHEQEISAALIQLAEMRDRLLQASASDELAYAAYSRASNLPKVSESEQQARKAAVDSALRTSADVPLGVAQTCVELLAALLPVSRFGNPSLISDAAVAALLAEAALRGAVVNVNVNAKLMKNANGDALLRKASELEHAGRTLAADVLEIVESR
jgi:formiminotetrahydrofolate cyclodeaminase